MSGRKRRRDDRRRALVPPIGAIMYTFGDMSRPTDDEAVLAMERIINVFLVQLAVKAHHHAVHCRGAQTIDVVDVAYQARHDPGRLRRMLDFLGHKEVPVDDPAEKKKAEALARKRARSNNAASMGNAADDDDDDDDNDDGDGNDIIDDDDDYVEMLAAGNPAMSLFDPTELKPAKIVPLDIKLPFLDPIASLTILPDFSKTVWSLRNVSSALPFSLLTGRGTGSGASVRGTTIALGSAATSSAPSTTTTSFRISPGKGGALVAGGVLSNSTPDAASAGKAVAGAAASQVPSALQLLANKKKSPGASGDGNGVKEAGESAGGSAVAPAEAATTLSAASASAASASAASASAGAGSASSGAAAAEDNKPRMRRVRVGFDDILARNVVPARRTRYTDSRNTVITGSPATLTRLREVLSAFVRSALSDPVLDAMSYLAWEAVGAIVHRAITVRRRAHGEQVKDTPWARSVSNDVCSAPVIWEVVPTTPMRSHGLEVQHLREAARGLGPLQFSVVGSNTFSGGDRLPPVSWA